MRYDYGCPKCDHEFEVKHPMDESPTIRCPKCNEISKRLITAAPVFYFRGNCYLDKRGCYRDMNAYRLAREDPYASMRQRGEKDELLNKLKKGGKRQKNAKHFHLGT